MVTVGRIARPHGRVGHVIVASESDFPDERFRMGQTLHVRRGGTIESLTIDASREQQGRWVLGFAGIASIDDAETLRDLELRIPATALKTLGDDTYYVFDLVGCDVRTPDGTSVGRVEKVQFGSATPLLVVGREPQEVLVPMTSAMCRRIDIHAKVIEIDVPDGLIELNWKKASPQ
jgi:16S rRNA processing protein RimM